MAPIDATPHMKEAPEGAVAWANQGMGASQVAVV